MTYSKKAVILVAALAALLAFGWAQKAESDIPSVPAESLAVGPIIAVEQIRATEEQEAWLKDLEQCESSGNPEAVNEVDRDGTASYGLLQFKPGTFAFFAKAYGIEGELMDPDAQRAIVRRMMKDPSIDWEWQFPDCVKKYIGRPPGVLY